MEIWSLVLSIIGALAWIPIIIIPFINSNRKINVSFLEYRILTNGFGVSAVTKKRKNGVLFLMVVNFFTKNHNYYPTRIDGEFKTKNGQKYYAELLDFSTITSNNDDGTKTTFCVPVEMEFNISRTVKSNTDNIKLVSFLVEKATFSQLTDIEEIRIILRSGKFQKKSIKITKKDFPRYNSTNILDKFEKQI